MCTAEVLNGSDADTGCWTCSCCYCDVDMLFLQSLCYTLSTQAVSITQGQSSGELVPHSALLSSQNSASVELARSSQSVFGAADGGVGAPGQMLY